jgi:UDP-glucose 4-epimerase
MKILVTGGAGFIARNLTEQLNKRYEITALNSKQLNLLDYSQVGDCIKNGKFDVVIHTATYDAAPKHSIKDPAKVLENNLRMFFNLARVQEHFGRLIYFGSGAEFSREHWQPKMKESDFDQHLPADQYGFSKYIMTKYARLNNKIYNLRLFGVFGKYDDWRTRFISNACSCAALGKGITINQNVFFDLLYIDDLVKIIGWFIDHQPKTNIYNVCTGKVYDFKSLAEKIVKISGKKLKIIIKQEGLGKEYSGDNSLLMRELADFKFTPIDESLKYLYDWCSLNKQLFK